MDDQVATGTKIAVASQDLSRRIFEINEVVPVDVDVEFQRKWKQRFFVLHKPSGSLPDQYELSYYNSEVCSKKKGSIDLDQCEQIIESLDSDQYPYLLAIKTIYRGKVRTYYLATNSEEDMTTWVQCLCRVCGLKQEDTPTDIPDSRLSQHGQSSAGSSTAVTPPVSASNSVRSTAAVTPTITTQPVTVAIPRGSKATSSTSSTNSQPPPSTSPQSYVFLNECTTGALPQKNNDRYGRTDSVDSVPDFPAPPPPAKKGSLFLGGDEDKTKDSLHDSVFDVYDHPPATGEQEVLDRPKSGAQDVYDRPRSGELPGNQVSGDGDAFYQVPAGAVGQSSVVKVKRNSSSSDVDLHMTVPLPMPRRSPRSAHSSLSQRPDSLASAGQAVVEDYDVPPPRHTSTSSQDGKAGGSPPPTPPQRPPKPHNLVVQSPYQNLPTATNSFANSGLNAVPCAPSKHSSAAAAFSYDVPRSSPIVSPPRDPSALDIAPPAPAPRSCGPSSGHAYLNTVPGLSASPSFPPMQDTSHPVKNGESVEAELVYADMDGLPPPSQCRLAPTPDLSYTDMSAAGSAERQDLGQVPPVAPRPPARSSTLPVHRGYGASGAAAADADAACIWSNNHTRSFKRDAPDMSPQRPLRPPPLEPRRPLLPARTEYASSSEDDDDLSTDGSKTHHDLSVVRMSTVPAAPDLDTEPELKYLDLALDTPPDPSRPAAAACHGTPTEYREIDFIKTRALQDTKKARDMKK